MSAGSTRSSSAPRWVDSVREIDAAWVLQTLRRRKWLVVLPTLVATVAAFFLLLLVPSRYSATTEVMLDTAQQQVVNIQAVLTDALPDQEAVDSQVEVFRSRGVAEKVITALDLESDPEFNHALVPDSGLTALGKSVRAGVDWLIGSVSGEEPPPLPEDIRRAQQRSSIVDAFLENLHVRLKAQSRVLQVTYSSEDPVKAWQIANKLAEVYLLDQLDAKYEAARRATQWLTEKIAAVRVDVTEMEQAVAQYRKRAGLLVGTDGNTLISQQISELSAQLIVARTARAEADAKLSQVRRRSSSKSAPVRRPTSSARRSSRPWWNRRARSSARWLRWPTSSATATPG